MFLDGIVMAFPLNRKACAQLLNMFMNNFQLGGLNLITFLFVFFSVLKLLDEEARKELTPLKLRKKAAKFARDTVKNQMKSFKVLFSLPLL
jgi:hypothetical protein